MMGYKCITCHSESFRPHLAAGMAKNLLLGVRSHPEGRQILHPVRLWWTGLQDDTRRLWRARVETN